MAHKINDSIKRASTIVANLATGGTIGTAAATVDIYSSIFINQTTANQTISIPNPTDNELKDDLYLGNVGTNFFFYQGYQIMPNTFATLHWSGTQWLVNYNRPLGRQTIVMQQAVGTANGTNLSPNGILMDGIDFTASYTDATFYQPKIINKTGAAITVTFATQDTITESGQYRRAINLSISNNAEQGIENDNLVYSTTGETTVVNSVIIVNNTAMYSYTVISYINPANTIRYYFLTVDKLL